MSKRILEPARVPADRRRVAATVTVVAGAPTDPGRQQGLGDVAQGAQRCTRPRCCCDDAAISTRMISSATSTTPRSSNRSTPRRRPTRSWRRPIKNGIAALDKADGRAVAHLSEGYQVEVLKQMQRRRSSRRCAARRVVALYNNKMVWPDFGYQGAPTSSAATSYAASRTPAGRWSPTPRPAPRRMRVEGGRTMASYDLNDDGVVVIIGSGAGGGTLGQRAGAEGHQGRPAWRRAAARARHLRQRRVGELRPARLARQAHDLGQLAGRPGLPEPAGLDLQDGRRHRPPTGPAPRCASRSTSSRRSTYGDVAGANLLDWPITLAEMEPYYDKAEDKMGVTRTNGIPGLPGNNNFKVLYTGAKRVGYKEVHTGRMAINSQPRDDRADLPADRLLLPGLQDRAQVVDALHRDPGGARRPASSTCAPNAGAADPARRRRQGDRRALCRQGRQAAGPEGARRLRRRQLDREPAAAAELRLGEVPGRARQLLGPGRPQLHAAHHRLGLRHLRAAGAHVPRHDHGRHRPGRGAPTIRSAASSAATSSRRCRWACRSWRRSSIPAPGAATSPARWTTTPNMAGMWIVGEDMPQRDQPRHPARDREGQVRAADPERAFRRPPQRHRDAQPCLQAGHGGLRGGRRRARSTRRRPIPRPTISAPTG